jgi:hypothetical protein
MEKEEEIREEHKADRVPGFFSSRLNWDPPPLQPQASVSPPLVPGGHTRLREKGWRPPIGTR